MSETNELAQLLEEVKALRARVQQLEEGQAPAATATTTVAKATQSPTSRRKMLKAGVLAAGLAVTGAAATAVSPHSAEAATGDPILIASDNTPSGYGSAPTRLYNSSTLDTSSILFKVDNTLNTAVTLPTNHIAIAGTSLGSASIGLYGASDLGTGVHGEGTTGVYGNGGSTGVAGNSPGGTGVSGYSFSGMGIYGEGDTYGVSGYANTMYNSGAGVKGESLTLGVLGIGNDANGTGIGGSFQGTSANLYLPASGSSPFSRTGAIHNAGEIVVDSNNDAWIFVGSNGWRKFGGPASAGTFHALTTLVRAVDTRSGHTNIAPSTYSSNGGTPTGTFTAGETRTYDFSVSGTTIPAHATAYSAVVTAVNPTMASGSTGFFTFWSGSATSLPAISQVTYNVPSIANSGSFISTLNSTRQFNIYTLKATDVIIDIVGYYL